MPLALVFAGTPEFAVPALEALVGAGHTVRVVCTQPDRPAGRGREPTASAVKRAALALGLPVLQPATLGESAVVAKLAACAADVMVVVAYGLMLPPALLAVPRLGCINVHASLLPRWRGAAPVQRALLAGDPLTGVSIMRMEAGLDRGPIYASAPLPIGARDTALELTRKLAALGARSLLTTLSTLEHGVAVPVAQPDAGATYAAKLAKREAELDWSRPAAYLDRQVRAFVPWPVAETRWAGMSLRIHAAEPLAEAAGAPPGAVIVAGAAGIDVATGAGRLRLLAVQLAGRGVVTASQFAATAARRAPLVGARLGAAA